MAIKDYTPDNTIDLSREEGNVFSLIALVFRLARQLDKDSESITKEMMRSDYGNALHVFDREFGEFIDLKLPPSMTCESVTNSYVKTNLTPEKMSEGYLK